MNEFKKICDAHRALIIEEAPESLGAQYLQEHIAQKKAIYERYRDGLSDLPVRMNPFDPEKFRPNYRLSCMIIDEGVSVADTAQRHYCG